MSDSLYDRNYLLLNASNFFYSLFSTVFIFLPAFLYRIGIREGEIGLLMATGTLVSVSLKPVNGLFVDRGKRRVFLAVGGILACAATLPWALVTKPGAHLFALRLFQGVSYSLFATASFAYVAAAAPAERRGEALGVFGLSFFIPYAVGGWLGEWVIGKAGFPGLFVAASVVALVSAAFPIGIREPKSSANLSLSSFREFLTRPYLAPNTAGFLFGMAFGSIFTFLPVFLLVRKISSIGVFLAVYALCVVATRTVGRRMSDRLPREWLSLFSLLLLAAGNLVIPFVSGTGGLAFVGALSGAGHGFLFPALSALILDRTPREKGGMAMAMFTASMDMGIVVGAAVFGFVAESHGYPAMFFGAAAATAAGAFVFFTQDPAFRTGSPRAPGP